MKRTDFWPENGDPVHKDVGVGRAADTVRLDTKAADQFKPVHRSGHGAITFEGREYTRLEWIERTARNGGTLAAGEGAVLCAELDRLREAVGAFTAWLAAEDSKPNYNGHPRETPEGQRIWREWWDNNLRLCAEALRLGSALMPVPAPTGVLCDDPCEDLPNCHCGERT